MSAGIGPMLRITNDFQFELQDFVNWAAECRRNLEMVPFPERGTSRNTPKVITLSNVYMQIMISDATEKGKLLRF
jgi:hypothetical protein